MSSLIKEFDSLRSDKQRWEWLIIHQDQGLQLQLDNDRTIIVDTTINPDDLEWDDESYWSSFDNYIGWSEGVFNLLHAIGIDCESV